MQQGQQQKLHRLPQQLEAALTNISAASGFLSPVPRGVLSDVASKFPKPTPQNGNSIILSPLGGTIFS